MHLLYKDNRIIMKKILIVTALAEFVRSFLTKDIEILQSMGYEVHCAANIHHPGKGGMMEYFIKHGVIFHQIDFSSNKPLSKKTLHSYKQFKNLIKENSFDVVHCHTPIVGAICRWACKKNRKNSGIKVIYTTHGFYFHKGSSKKTWLLYRNIEDFMSRYSDAIITINNEDFENAKKMHCRNVFYIPGVGVDTKRFIDTKIDVSEYRKSIGINEDNLLILAIGELSVRKNHQIVIKAINKSKLSNAVFMICGNAMNSDNTKELLMKLADECNVDLRLMGLRNDIPEICKCADIGVMPSLREGLGLSGIEMLSCGVPLVASNVHGIKDYVKEGLDGYLCDPYNELEFAEALNKLIDKTSRKAMELECIHIAKKFDKEHSISKMREIYKSILDTE